MEQVSPTDREMLTLALSRFALLIERLVGDGEKLAQEGWTHADSFSFIAQQMQNLNGYFADRSQGKDPIWSSNRSFTKLN